MGRINYYKVMSQANQIYDQARDLARIIAELERHVERVRIEWQGNASNEYQKQINNLIKDARVAKEHLIDLSGDIKFAAKRIRETDEELAKNLEK